MQYLNFIPNAITSTLEAWTRPAPVEALSYAEQAQQVSARAIELASEHPYKAAATGTVLAATGAALIIKTCRKSKPLADAASDVVSDLDKALDTIAEGVIVPGLRAALKAITLQGLLKVSGISELFKDVITPENFDRFIVDFVGHLGQTPRLAERLGKMITEGRSSDEAVLASGVQRFIQSGAFKAAAVEAEGSKPKLTTI